MKYSCQLSLNFIHFVSNVCSCYLSTLGERRGCITEEFTTNDDTLFSLISLLRRLYTNRWAEWINL